jgi:class 3 adenylate cyclase
VIRRRGRFAELIERQLALFAAEHAGLIADCEAALRAYDRASREEAEERYGDFVDLVETATEQLAGLRDGFAGTLDEAAAAQYRAAFNQAVVRRFPRFAVELEDV